MANGKHIAYLRVSTDKQGRSGLGIEAQREAIARYLNGGDWTMVKEYVEVESGKRADRPKLAAALAHCKRVGAVLVIAKLDRLARNVHFLSGLMDSGVEFVAADNPHANRLTVHILAAVAEDEAKRISERTKAALAAAKARGVKLGSRTGGAHLRGLGNGAAVAAVKTQADRFATELLPVVEEIRSEGYSSLNAIAGELNQRGILTARGGKWYPMTVKLILDRLAA